MTLKWLKRKYHFVTTGVWLGLDKEIKEKYKILLFT
jgi:hypothetical protein